jgi:hypothetical protein
VLALLAHAALVDARTRALTLKVSPTISFAPAQLAILVRLQPNPDDRWLTVGMDDGNYRRVSAFTIEGDRVLYRLDWRDVPAGDYVLVAAVGATTERAHDSVRVIIAER